jgi:hypothetical protein
MGAALPVVLLLHAGLSSAGEQDLATKGSIHGTVAVDTGRESAHEDSLEALTRLAYELRWETRGGGDMVASVVAEHWLQAGPSVRARVAMWPDELRWDRPLGERGHLRLGQQVNRWGQLEGLSLVDVLNPRDLRHGPGISAEEARIAVPMLRIDLGPPALQAQLCAIPWHVPSRYHLLGSDWSLYPSGLVEELVAGTAGWGGDPATEALFGGAVAAFEERLRAAEPSAWWGADQLLRGASEPWQPFGGSELGLRLGYQGERAVLGIQGARLRSDMPALTLDPTLLGWATEQRWPSLEELEQWVVTSEGPVTVAYPYSWFGGLDARLGVGAVGLALEAAYRSDVPVTTTQLAGVTQPELGVALGLEYQGSTQLRAGLEGSWRHLVEQGGVEGDGLLGRRRDEATVATWLALSLFRQRLEPRLNAVWAPSFGEGALVGAVAWRPRDPWELSLHGWWFHARTDTPRSLEELVAYQGGTLGMFNDNDALAARFTYFL